MKRLISILLLSAMLALTLASCDIPSEDSLYYGFDFPRGFVVEGSVLKPEELTELNIPDSFCFLPIVRIEGELFKGYDKLVSLKLGKNISVIEPYAFEDCTSLREVSFSNGLFEIRNGAFRNCISLEEIRLPDTVGFLRYEAFSGCTSLNTVVLPGNLVRLEGRVFANCTSLKEIELPATLTYLNVDAFSGCTAIENIYVASGNEVFESVDGVLFSQKGSSSVVFYPAGRRGADYVVPNNTNSIGEWAFSGNTHLESVTFSSNVVEIEMSAFRDCTLLKKISFEGDGCDLGESAFEGCTSLEVLELPDLMSCIENRAFWRCTSLKELNLPSSIMRIGDGAFGLCTSLEVVTLPDGVDTIGEQAFTNCTSLREIYLPASIRYIGAEAFRWCEKLEKISYAGTMAEWEEIYFGEEWNKFVSLKTVICSDGVVNIR